MSPSSMSACVTLKIVTPSLEAMIPLETERKAIRKKTNKHRVAIVDRDCRHSGVPAEGCNITAS
jgi:hypothetical protein